MSGRSGRSEFSAVLYEPGKNGLIKQESPLPRRMKSGRRKYRSACLPSHRKTLSEIRLAYRIADEVEYENMPGLNVLTIRLSDMTDG